MAQQALYLDLLGQCRIQSQRLFGSIK